MAQKEGAGSRAENILRSSKESEMPEKMLALMEMAPSASPHHGDPEVHLVKAKKNDAICCP